MESRIWRTNHSFPLPKRICIWITCFYHFEYIFSHIFHTLMQFEEKKKVDREKDVQHRNSSNFFSFEIFFGMLSHANVSVQSNQSPPTYKFFMHFCFTSAELSGMKTFSSFVCFFFSFCCSFCECGCNLFARSHIIVNEWVIFTLEFIVDVKEAQ